MADVRPHVLRITVLAACLLTVFLFFDPVGFASSAPGLVHRVAGTNGNTNGVTHIVLFQFKSDVDSDTINKICAKMLALKESCRLPNSNYAYIESISGGRDNSIESLQHGATHAFVVQFSSTDHRNYYVDHDPAHQAFKEEVGPLVEKVTVLDYSNGQF
ncbi:hypothetical protein VTJ04DRAFT_115 [Mycothermus thermophilus]|uniref:uncharacterized protein n=1 Tax=Humicola insolens TaxID=85995 RepID=UPI0037444264